MLLPVASHKAVEVEKIYLLTFVLFYFLFQILLLNELYLMCVVTSIFCGRTYLRTKSFKKSFATYLCFNVNVKKK